MLTASTVYVEALHIIDTGLADSIEPWRALLGSETTHPVLPSDEVRVALLVLLAPRSAKLTDRVLLYLELRCRWLKDQEVFRGQLELPAVNALLDRIAVLHRELVEKVRLLPPKQRETLDADLEKGSMVAEVFFDTLSVLAVFDLFTS